MEPAYYTNFGGAVLRYGEVPAIGVLESPDNHMPIGMAFPIRGRPRAWRCPGS